MKKPKQLILLDESLKKLIELGIATIDNGKYQYSPQFEQTIKELTASPPGKLKQLKLAHEAGRKLIPELLTIATGKPTKRDIENMITAYVCLKIHIEKQNLQVNKKILPDLAYAVWYLNDHEPTIEEVEEWR